MIVFFKILILHFFLFCSLFSQELKDDEEYYNEGVKYYDNGDFKKSFIVFFNLSEKGNKDAIYNLSNMYFQGIGTTQNYNKSLKYSWLCALNGNKKCIKKLDKVKKKLDEKEVIIISEEIPKLLEEDFKNKSNIISAFKLGYWYEKISPEIDLEKSYLWYSVSVSAGVYKAMKLRDRVGDLIEREKIKDLQIEASKIFNKDKYFKGKKDDL
ncbi:MAG: hypothetical protein CMM95_03235 [Rickettsiales bacterium]|nr:hypothetical protein [Rickettsiales bacterium]